MRFKALFIVSLIFCTPLQANTSDAAQRIVSLAPSLTELAYSAGAGDKLVGVVNFSDYPPAALSIANVGSYNAINLERIIELKPDLILAWQSGNAPNSLARLRKMGFSILVRDTQRLEDIPQLIEEIGEFTATQTAAQAEAARLRHILQQLQQNYANRSKVRVFYQVWNQPLITIGGPQFISQALALCGAENIFSDLETLAPHVSIEAVIQRDPDLILLGGLSPVQQQWLNEWRAIPHLKAINQDLIYPFNADHFQRPTARLIDALDTLCNQIDQARKKLNLQSS